MSKWEYCEIEVVYKGSGAESSMYLLKPDGSHEQSSGGYGEMTLAPRCACAVQVWRRSASRDGSWPEWQG